MKKNFEIDELEASAINTALTEFIMCKSIRQELSVVHPDLALHDGDLALVKMCCDLQAKLADMLSLRVSWRSD